MDDFLMHFLVVISKNAMRIRAVNLMLLFVTLISQID